MYAIDEYYDELDETSTPSVDNVHACILNEEQTLCWKNLVLKEYSVVNETSTQGFWDRMKQKIRSTCHPKRTEHVTINSPFGYLSTQGGIISVVGRNGLISGIP